MLAPPDLERLLVVVAHPDDVDFGAAGSVAALTEAGVAVTYCLVTSGDAGGSDRSVSRADMVQLRETEQTRAAKAVGVTDLVFLRFPDGRVEATLELRAAISRVIRQVRPQVVLCQSATRNLDRIYAGHPDHLAAGEAAICAVYPDARNPFAFPELLTEGHEPWAVDEVWIMGASMTETVGYGTIDITDVIERKIEALLCHESQLPDPDRMAQLMRDWASGTAGRFGLEAGRMAEAFRVVDTR
jgi:LmbE family N-acetylglucosaminyl deacetylase